MLASLLALYWAMGSKEVESSWQGEPEGGEAVVESKATMLGGALERDYGNARLDLTVRVRHDGIHPLVMKAPQVRLMAGEREVPSFFLPAERLPEVAPKTTTEVTLRYWLETTDLQGPLALEVDGEKVPVKSATAFDLATLENGKPKALRGVEW